MTPQEEQDQAAEPCEFCGSPDHAIGECLEHERDGNDKHDPYPDPGDMDGDHASALASAGLGTDEDYGAYAEPADPLDDDRDPENPAEYSEGYDWAGHDFDSDPDWR